MKQQNIFIKSVVFAGISLTLQACGNPSQPNKSTAPNAAIFTEAETSETAALVQSQSESLTQTAAQTKKLRYVHVNLPALKKILNDGTQSVVRLNFFDDQPVDVMLEHVDKKSPDNIVVVGRIVGDSQSEVSLVVNQDVLIGNVRRGDGSDGFEIRTHGNGLHSVSVPVGDQEENCIEINEGPVAGEKRTGDIAALSSDQASVMATPVVRVLGAYTPQARAYAGGTAAIVALIQKGVADTNQAMVDSGVPMQVVLAGTMETASSESSDIARDLSALRSTNDGRFDDVHAMRRKVAADQVSLVGSYSRYSTAAGIGYVKSSYSNAFTVTKAMYFRQYTFSHELGHNLGLNHEDGFVSGAGRFRTIIAYGTYPRIRRYSNPNLKYNGYYTGDSLHNESKILNANSVRMSLLAP
jgi:hypothetical protein